MIADGANCIGSTRRRARTWIETMVLDAGMVSRTIGVSPAANLAEIVLADFPVEALSVAVTLHVTPAFDTSLI